MTAAASIVRSRLDEALDLARAGHLVVWCHALAFDDRCTCGNGLSPAPGRKECPKKNWAKHPILTGWTKKATSDEQTLRDQFKELRFTPNLGVLGGPQPNGSYLVAVDVDDADRFAALVEEYGPLPSTRAGRSPGGPRLLFTLPQAVARKGLKNITGLGGTPGVDVKIDGGQVVVVGRNVRGEYSGLDLSVPIAELPATWAAAIMPKAPAQPAPKPRATLTSTTEVERTRAYVETIEGAIQGQRGSDATYRVACKIVASVSDYSAQAALLDEFNARCVPPWSDSELAHKLSDARKDPNLRPLADRPLRSIMVPKPQPVANDDDDDAAEPEPEHDDGPRVRVGEPWEKGLILSAADKEGRQRIIPNAANAATVLRSYPDWIGVIAQDTFEIQTTATRLPPWHPLDMPDNPTAGPWTDADSARAVNWFARTWVADLPPIALGVKTIEQALSVVADTNSHHPVREYLRELKWDGKKRVDALAHCYFGTEDTAYTSAVGACFMIGAVARVMVPGCKLDTMMILEGEQGAFKSTGVRTLGGPFFCDTPIPFGTKDAYQQTRGVWIYELGELATFTKADAAAAKVFMSSAVDRYRPSYGRREIKVPRQCIFVGTTNGKNYLNDSTGARRYPVLKTGRIDIAAIAADRDQLWAEAVARFDAGEPWHLVGALAAEAANEAEARFSVDPWEDKIAKLAATTIHMRDGITAQDVFEHLEVKPALQTKAMEMRIADIMTDRLKWEKRRPMKDGVRAYRYYAPAAP